MKRKILILFISIISLDLSATHIMGGEITWVCIKDSANPDFGKYIFQMKVYYDCAGVAGSSFAQTLDVWDGGVNPLTSMSLNYISSIDISPNCDVVNSGFPALDCISNPVGAVEEYIYESQPIVLLGTPPVTGWHFTWDSCCRNASTSNLVLTGGVNPVEGFTLRASMFPYLNPNGIILPSNGVCYDNSPIFKEQAKTILCIGYPFSYSNLGFDVELDSLSYNWDEPLDDIDFGTAYISGVNPLPIPFLAGYGINNPLPGGVTLDNISGEISYNSNISGNFASVIRSDAFKCGQKVASIYREIQVVLMNCGSLSSGNPNTPPQITAPIPIPEFSQYWDTTFNVSTNLPSYETSVSAGKTVKFKVIAIDTNITSSGSLQNLSLEVEGGQLDPNLALGNYSTFSVDSIVPGYIRGEFEWKSNCDHLQNFGCGMIGGAFTFNMKAYDDFCPANGIVIATITINITAPEPDLRCLSVDSAGNVELSFLYPEGVSDTNINYKIYHSKQIDGSYTLLGSVNFPDTTYFHSSDANSSKSYYFLSGNTSCGSEIVSGNDSLLNSDTLSTIFMDVSAINMGLTADLIWNNMHTPLLASSSSNYALHYMNNSNDDILYSILTDTFTQINGDNCDYMPAFYVEISDGSGCISKSSIGVVNLLDSITPLIPSISNVSVNYLGKSVVSWESSLGANYYIIYLEDFNGGWITLDTVGLGINFYEFFNSLAFQKVENFSVRAVDSCGNSRERSIKHNSIFLEYTSDVCNQTISLDWNDYINWESGVSNYKVFLLEIDEYNVSTNTEIRVSLNTDLVINNINFLSTYTIYVEASNYDSTSVAVSNALNVSVAIPNSPLFNYLEYATVNHDNGLIEINCLVDNNAVIDHYDIYRTEEFDINGVGVNFTKIDEINFSENTSFIFNDNLTNTNTTSYRYKVYPVDTCGVRLSPPPVDNPSYLGDVSYAQSILLVVEKNINYPENPSFSGDFTNTLVFNEYEKWLGEVSKYELFRSVNNEPFNLLPIYSWNRINNSDEELRYIDVVTNEGKGNGRFCYYIKATEGNITPYLPALSGSYSNIACVSQTPVIYIPNTFTPNRDDHNEIFKPFTYFVSDNGYLFSIYNKFGKKLFETNNPQKGWDGSFKNSLVQNDNYVYYLQYVNADGELSENTGVITLVK